VDRDATRKDGPSMLSSAKSQTHATEVHRASSSVSNSFPASSSAPSHLVASSKWSAHRARPNGRPNHRSRPLKPRAPLLQFLEFGNQLAYNFRPEGLNRQAPKHRLRGRRHRCLKHGKLSGHLSIAEGSNAHPTRQVLPHPWWANNGKTQLGVLGPKKGELLKLLLEVPLRHHQPPRWTSCGLSPRPPPRPDAPPQPHPRGG
jgi:hypothetical protein